ncbi:uracil-DNA glycosylase [Arcanobacterium hippocoleae]|uniref:Uracil-DNA glycosylase n=1 Tax=Arcanobacterium hippocoleae TaxID=149017 RepID=A0ABU1T344_9ACTO|nr:uracil-DNA glycosylase [Arcanobacterium hippocoleae]MDR6939807.1 uracil-DNA glycosylase [Arcanobacterium hippocoleae]
MTQENTSQGSTLPDSSLSEIMAPDWANALSAIAPQIHQMGNFLRREISLGRNYLPAGKDVFHAFRYPLADVRVLIVGQDPYPTPGHPIGLSFSVARDVAPLPRSLTNIYRELQTDLQISPARHGDLTAWCERGVMLLNRVLTVHPGSPASHRGKGWEEITEFAIKTLVQREKPLVAILWGRQAQELTPLLGDTPIIASAHPSPLSASRGFFGSKPFSRANQLLQAQGAAPIDWQLD